MEVVADVVFLLFDRSVGVHNGCTALTCSQPPSPGTPHRPAPPGTSPRKPATSVGNPLPFPHKATAPTRTHEIFPLLACNNG
ncbi:hypothetical protein JB92DRAFT_3041112 [Gautieria morchelliformis]|nr:hypothetical protein JB92DRAFT_3041112 [Gautieria morchelliformis]